MPNVCLRAIHYLCAMTLSVAVMFAAEHHGEVRFNGRAVPGAVVTAAQGQTVFTTVTGITGAYAFANLADGDWLVTIQMPGFAPVAHNVSISDGKPGEVWDLTMLPLSAIMKDSSPDPRPRTEAEAAQTKAPATTSSSNAMAPEPPIQPAHEPALGPNDVEELNSKAADGLLINGSVNNGGASLFGQSRAFGNDRKGARALYNGNLGILLDNSALDARAFSLSGQKTPQPAYNHVTGVASFGGPLRIPHLLWHSGPNLSLNYEWTRNRNATTQAGLVPSLQERNGDLSGAGHPIVFDPNTLQLFPGNIIPADRLSPQARALLAYYPLPNSTGGTGYNYQIPTVASVHQDSWQARASREIHGKDQLFGSSSGQRTRTDSSNLFHFVDSTKALGLNTAITWQHLFTSRFSMSLGYQYSYLSLSTQPYFAARTNVSGQAGIQDNNQDPTNWGPPALVFAAGTAGLSDLQSSATRNRTNGFSSSALWNHGRHNLKFGGDLRRQQFNLLSQQDPRGTFGFTGAATRASSKDAIGAATGSDLADFLLGIPDTSSIAFGNSDKYLRASAYDAFVTDDFRASPGFTLNAGVRWDYTSPVSEEHNRLVNLDIAPRFVAVAPVLGGNPIGSTTGERYPHSLIRPDLLNIQPRVGIAWRPLSDSSMVLRAGYGVYYNSSVYLPIAMSMAQQAPLSTAFSIQNSAAHPLTLANGFSQPSNSLADTYAVDPNLRVGYAQNWNLSIQRDLPWSGVLTASYLGIKGTHGQQQFLPNTFPYGTSNPCPSCPSGFIYLTSGGSSTREAGQLQLRRRLHDGFTASLEYTYSKSLDDSSLGGGNTQSQSVIAQDWLNLKAERGPSTFDQRHLLGLLMQYTSGMGKGGAALLSGWQGTLLRDWTFLTQINTGSGLPETPIYFAPAQGTGITGSLRPSLTGASVTDAPAGRFLNPAAYTSPTPGHWGTAGRNSIIGPRQFALDASLGRTFRMRDPVTLDLRIDSTNMLNHPSFTSWNTVMTSAQFGLPSAANAMRSVRTTLRVRF